MSQVLIDNAQDLYNVVQQTYSTSGPLLTAPVELHGSDGRTTQAYGAFFGGTTAGDGDQATGPLENIATAVGNLGPYSRQAEAIIRQEATLGQTVVLAGHSLGGGVAERVAVELQKDKNGDGRPDYDVQLVTFGAPVWTDGRIADDRRTDFVAQGDPVPYLGFYTSRPQNTISPEDGRVFRAPFGSDGAHGSYQDDVFGQFEPFGNDTNVTSITYDTGQMHNWNIRGIGSYLQGTAPVTEEGVERAQFARAEMLTTQLAAASSPEQRDVLLAEARGVLNSAMGSDRDAVLPSEAPDGSPSHRPLQTAEARDPARELASQPEPAMSHGLG